MFEANPPIRLPVPGAIRTLAGAAWPVLLLQQRRRGRRRAAGPQASQRRRPEGKQAKELVMFFVAERRLNGFRSDGLLTCCQGPLTLHQFQPKLRKFFKETRQHPKAHAAPRSRGSFAGPPTSHSTRLLGGSARQVAFLPRQQGAGKSGGECCVGAAQAQTHNTPPTGVRLSARRRGCNGMRKTGPSSNVEKKFKKSRRPVYPVAGPSRRALHIDQGMCCQ